MKVSVIIPAYKCGRYIVSALENIRAQTMSKNDIETIIYVDGGKDNTATRAREYAANHPNMQIKIIVSDKNRGVSYARNAGVAAARGEYIHFYDADDLINPEFYMSLYNAANRHESDVAVASFIHERWPGDGVLFSHENVLILPQDKLNHTRVDLCGYSWRYLIRRTWWNKMNFKFPTDMRYCEDMLIMVQMIFYSNSIVLVPSAIYTYKFRENSALTRPDNKSARNHDYARAISDVDQFLNLANLRPNHNKYNICRCLLFGLLPFMTIRTSPCKTRTHYKLFGKIPLLSLRHKTVDK